MLQFLEEDIKLHTRRLISEDIVHKPTFNIYK